MLFIYSFSSFAQNKVENYIKTSEYDKYGNKRRDIYLDSSMQIIKEEYYAKDNHQVIFKIEYSEDQPSSNSLLSSFLAILLVLSNSLIKLLLVFSNLESVILYSSYNLFLFLLLKYKFLLI